jgi:hypothetical protein
LYRRLEKILVSRVNLSNKRKVAVKMSVNLTDSTKNSEQDGLKEQLSPSKSEKENL